MGMPVSKISSTLNCYRFQEKKKTFYCLFSIVQYAAVGDTSKKLRQVNYFHFIVKRNFLAPFFSDPVLPLCMCFDRVT